MYGPAFYNSYPDASSGNSLKQITLLTLSGINTNSIFRGLEAFPAYHDGEQKTVSCPLNDPSKDLSKMGSNEIQNLKTLSSRFEIAIEKYVHYPLKLWLDSDDI